MSLTVVLRCSTSRSSSWGRTWPTHLWGTTGSPALRPSSAHRMPILPGASALDNFPRKGGLKVAIKQYGMVSAGWSFSAILSGFSGLTFFSLRFRCLGWPDRKNYFSNIDNMHGLVRKTVSGRLISSSQAYGYDAYYKPLQFHNDKLLIDLLLD